MAFGKITQALAIPLEATASYTFHRFQLCDAGPPTLVCRHAGDGTPTFQSALVRAVNIDRQRNAGRPPDRNVTPAKIKSGAIDEAKLIADHCVLGWANVYDDGDPTPTPCTPAKVLELLTTVIEATDGLAQYRAFSAWIQDSDTFRPPQGDTAELGKA